MFAIKKFFQYIFILKERKLKETMKETKTSTILYSVM